MEVYSDEERAKFEKAFGTGHPSDVHTFRRRQGAFLWEYDDKTVQYAWIGWNYKVADIIGQQKEERDFRRSYDQN